MLILIITNIILDISAVIIGIVAVVDMVRDNRPIVIKEAKALREYYEGKLGDMEEKTDKAEQKCAEYKGLYESEIRRNSDMDSIRSKKDELEAKVERLTHELNSCEDRISDMAKENAELKEQIKELEKPAKKKEGK